MRHHAGRGAGGLRLARRHHPAVPRDDRREGPPPGAHPQRPGPGPAQALRFGFERAAAPGRRGDHGRRQRRPHPDRAARAAGRAGRGRGRRLPLHPRRPAGRRPVPQGPDVAAGRAHALLVRPGRHPRRHQLVQGLRCRVRPPGRHRVRGRLRDGHRAGRQGPPPPASRWPSCPPSGSTGAWDRRTSSSRPGSRTISVGTATRSAGGSREHRSGQRVVRLHRRLRRPAAAGRRPHRHRHRQPLEVRRGGPVLRRPPELPAGRGRRLRHRPDDRPAQPTATTSSPAPR